MPPKREGDRLDVQDHEASLLALVIDDVQSVKEGFHSRIRGPQRNHQAEDEAKPERATALRSDAFDLIADDFQGATGQDA